MFSWGTYLYSGRIITPVPRILEAHVESRHGERGIVFNVRTLGGTGVTQSQRAKAYILTKFPSAITDVATTQTELAPGSRGLLKEYNTEIFVPQSSISENISLTRILEMVKSKVNDITQ